MKRIAIIGIGGIGGYIGANLLRKYFFDSSKEFIFIQRGQHYLAIRDNGLTFISDDEYIVRPNTILENPNDAGFFDLIFVAVKSNDLETAMISLRNNISPTTIIIPIMNGINNCESVKRIYSNNVVLKSCIYVSSHIEKAGIVKQCGAAGYLFIEKSATNPESSQFVADLLNQALIRVKLTDEIDVEVWKKYVFIASLATITSQTGCTIGEIVRHNQYKMQWICLMQELVGLAKLEGISLPNDLIDSFIERATKIPIETKTSMQIDVENGKQTEFDILVEYPVRRAQTLGQHLIVYNEYFAALKSMGIK